MFNKIKNFYHNRIFLAVSMLVISASLLMPLVDIQGVDQSYSTGDAIVYHNEIIIGSTNTGVLEIFKQSGNEIVKQANIVSFSNKYDRFFDVAFSQEGDKLYAYIVNGGYLLKYNISNTTQPALISSIKDNADDWFMRVQRINDYIVTTGSKGVKPWNFDMQVVDNYVNPDKNYNVSLAKNGQFLFDVKTDYNSDTENDLIKVIDTSARKVIADEQIVLNHNYDRQVYFDSDRQLVYIVGDRVLKQINLKTKAVDNFKHAGGQGFSADGIAGKDYVYFSDGLGVVKIGPNMKLIDGVHIYKLAVADSWSMGIRALDYNGQDRVVVFNHSNIMVLDGNLDLVAYYKPQEYAPQTGIDNVKEPLSLSLDKNRAPRNTQISLHGTGFGAYEELSIEFLKRDRLMGESIKAQADANGGFSKIITIPSDMPAGISRVSAINGDIKVTGLSSELNYSIGFTIE
ncbi:MAG: hypothetical protein ABIH48_02320 [Candidatus Falkowbacteria bacterium]